LIKTIQKVEVTGDGRDQGRTEPEISHSESSPTASTPVLGLVAYAFDSGCAYSLRAFSESRKP
jgi:hypothetical protein